MSISENVKKRISKNIGSNSLKIDRVFTKNLNNPFEGIEFEKRTSKITNPDGSTVFEMNDVEVPSNWSQIATDILAQKYLRKKGVPIIDEQGNPVRNENGEIITGSEKSAKQAVTRLAKTWRWWGEKYGYFDSNQDADAFEHEIARMLIDQIAAPNSPQWFNTGLSLMYGIKGHAQGHWYVDPETKELKQSEDAYTRTQAHACFILSIKDDLVNKGGIYDTLTTEARIFKYGSGSGINFSPLRAEGESLSGGGKSSGLMSFLKIFDTGAGAIKSGGTTRRAAKMVCVDMDHPEIEKFIEWKVVEERKVLAIVAGSKSAYQNLKNIFECAEKNGTDIENNKDLQKAIIEAYKNNIPANYIKRVLMLVENGVKSSEFTFEVYDTDFRSEAYATVSGQNSNNSVRIPNTFFEKMFKDENWDLINRTDGNVNKSVKAKYLWDKIVRSAWESADPGVQYDSTINEWHTCPESGRINASNPCSEYMFLDNTACNLASLNLLKFYDSKNKTFDIEKFQHAVRLWTIVLEISVLMSHLPTDEVALNTYKFRTLGLGYGNLGALLMQMGIPYESDEGYAITGAITAVMGGESYATSAELASILGTFEEYQKNKDHMLRVIRNHRRAAYGADDSEYENLTIKPFKLRHDLLPEYLSTSAKTIWDQALELGEEYGYRNAQTTLIAPTGTIGLLMDFDTTGIEPDFALVKFKKLVGGGYFKIVNQGVRPALGSLGYSEAEIQDIEKYIIGYQTLENAPFINHKTLTEKGFTFEVIQQIESAIQFGFDLKSTFKWNISEDFLAKELKIEKDKFNNPNFDILEYLGFSKEEIEKANEYVFGTMTIEGAPHIKDEHLPIFDCANKCGNKGKRYISTIGHIKQMAAAQPFLSGAISKTVNLPENASFKDVEDAYLLGWKHMLKAVALYRDGSKLSQPLNTGSDKYSQILSDLANLAQNNEQVMNIEVEVKDIHNSIKNEVSNQHKPLRRKLPQERHSITHKFEVGGYEGYIIVGLYEDGSPGEIFIKVSTVGSFLAGIMDAFAITLSMNLQYGVPLEALVNKLTNLKFEPSGMTNNKEIPIAKSIIDYIGRWLALKFLDPERAKLYHNPELVDRSYREGSNYRIRIPMVNGKGYTELKNNTKLNDEAEKVIENNLPKLIDNNILDENISNYDKAKNAISMGYTGEVCKQCGSMKTIKSGSCSVCSDCGSTTGCS